MFRSSETSAFSEPDGSIFVSDTLVQQLNDTELTAILAHEMGHVRYGHNRSFWKVASTPVKAAAATGIVVGYLALMGLGVSQVSHSGSRASESFPEKLHRREREMDANWAAASYLAKLDIPPDYLFDTLLKLASYRNKGWKHGGIVSAAYFGRMLDEGVVPGQINNPQQTEISCRPYVPTSQQSGPNFGLR